MDKTFHRRPLPINCIQFSGTDGKAVFRDSLLQGQTELYFTLSEVFNRQSEPAFCGLSTLCMILNCLSVDPSSVHGARGVWKGPWRWYHEELLDCCLPLEYIVKNGISIDEVDCLAQCNGLNTDVMCSPDLDADSFRQLLRRLCSQPNPVEYIVVNYNRQVLGQTGTGHFSPIAAYESTRDLVLIMDVAQFKYPPHWVPLVQLIEAMKSIDPSTGRSRGYIIMSKVDVSYVSSIFTVSGLTNLDNDVWDNLRSWVATGLCPKSQYLFLFIKNFCSNYTIDTTRCFLKSLRLSPLFQLCPFNDFKTPVLEILSDVEGADTSISLEHIDCISWILLTLGVEWAKFIIANNVRRSTDDEVNSCVSSCCTVAKELRPRADDIPSCVSEHITGDIEEDSAISITSNSAFAPTINELVSLTGKLLVIMRGFDSNKTSGQSCCRSNS